MKRLIIATGNSHKVAEFAKLLEGSGFQAESANSCGGMPAVEETGETFAENARIKALALRAVAPRDRWILSDDSGLEVDALSGAPGVHSARYAGFGATDGDNVEKLLLALAVVPPANRLARFRCVLCLIGPDGKEHFFDGACEGSIADKPLGKNGFGYDPVFIPEGYAQTFGELDGSVKSRLSHRALAAGALRSAVF